LPVVVNANADSTDVPPAWFVGKRFDSDHSDDAVFEDSDKVVITTGLF
jgi:hypothetical protein